MELLREQEQQRRTGWSKTLITVLLALLSLSGIVVWCSYLTYIGKNLSAELTRYREDVWDLCKADDVIDDVIGDSYASAGNEDLPAGIDSYRRPGREGRSVNSRKVRVQNTELPLLAGDKIEKLQVKRSKVD